MEETATEQSGTKLKQADAKDIQKEIAEQQTVYYTAETGRNYNKTGGTSWGTVFQKKTDMGQLATEMVQKITKYFKKK